MASKTVHVFPSDGHWEIKKEGQSSQVFPTQQEAINAAKKTAKHGTAGQFVVHGKRGEIRQHRAYKLTLVQDPPRKSTRANAIARAVGKVALRRVQSDTIRERSSKK